MIWIIKIIEVEKLFVDLNDKKNHRDWKIICKFEEKRWYVKLFVDLTNKKKIMGVEQKKIACLGIICVLDEKNYGG